MADYNRNQGSRSNQDWDRENENDRNDRWNDRSSGSWSSQQMNHDYGQGGMGSTYGQDQRGRRGRQYEDQNDWTRESGSGRMGPGRQSEFGSGSYGGFSGGNQDRNYGYGGREYGSSYGGGNYQGNSSYWDSGSQGSSGRSSYGSSRNLYDRDYEGFNRGEGYRSNMGNSGNMGGGNYGGQDERRRSYDENPYYGSSNMRNYSGSNYGNYGRSRDQHRDVNDRSWWDRTKDEVSSWFGDEEAERRRERDMRLSHRGKGPRNYTRSDDRIKEDINDRLSDDPWVDASEIDVTVSNGEVTLTGSVNDRGDKRRAEDLAEAVSGVRNVENRIRVTSRSNSGIGSGSGSMHSTTETSASQTGVTGSGASGDKTKNKSSFVSNT